MKHADCASREASVAAVPARRLSGRGRRAQLLETAEAQFAATGLHGTTTAALARAAGITEPVLYQHYPSKECLFREAVAHNVEKRLETLDARLAALDAATPAGCVEAMAEATVAVCVCETAHAVLTNWALLEIPEYAIDLHRREIGRVLSMWERIWAGRFPDQRPPLAQSLAYTVHACVAYGLWLAGLRHGTKTAAPLARQFAAAAARAARVAAT